MYYALSFEHPTEGEQARKTLLTRSVSKIQHSIKNNDYTSGAPTDTSGTGFTSPLLMSPGSLPHSQVFLGHVGVHQAVNRSFLISTPPHLTPAGSNLQTHILFVIPSY